MKDIWLICNLTWKLWTQAKEDHAQFMRFQAQWGDCALTQQISNRSDPSLFLSIELTLIWCHKVLSQIQHLVHLNCVFLLCVCFWGRKQQSCTDTDQNTWSDLGLPSSIWLQWEGGLIESTQLQEVNPYMSSYTVPPYGKMQFFG